MSSNLSFCPKPSPAAKFGGSHVRAASGPLDSFARAGHCWAFLGMAVQTLGQRARRGGVGWASLGPVVVPRDLTVGRELANGGSPSPPSRTTCTDPGSWWRSVQTPCPINIATPTACLELLKRGPCRQDVLACAGELTGPCPSSSPATNSGLLDEQDTSPARYLRTSLSAPLQNSVLQSALCTLLLGLPHS